jgi:hypothetical protein
VVGGGVVVGGVTGVVEVRLVVVGTGGWQSMLS